MITPADLNDIKKLKETNPDIYNLLAAIDRSNYDDLSAASHQIKNMLSFLNSSYQIISASNPDTKDIEFWEDIGSTIRNLITFMDKTSDYRYCHKNNPRTINITDILFNLPDEFDNICDENSCQFSFNISNEDILIRADSDRLKIAFLEILKNCFEASGQFCPILISASETGNNLVCIEISSPKAQGTGSIESNPSNLVQTWCKPFYSTKENHVGLGLSIVYRVCLLNNAQLNIENALENTNVKMLFPIVQTK